MRIEKYNLADFGNRYVEVYGAHSESSNKIYTVALNKKGVWSCGCPRWTMNRNRPDCKHIKFVKAMREQKTTVKVAEVAMPEQVRKKLSTFAAIEI
jgi:predicted nucleic acid-binding Zn finger protein